MGQKLFGSLNPVHTGGPMQVSIALPSSTPMVIRGNGRHRAPRFSVYVAGCGSAPIICSTTGTSYSVPLYRFADFNAGWYASRNAAFQNAVLKPPALSWRWMAILFAMTAMNPERLSWRCAV